MTDAITIDALTAIDVRAGTIVAVDTFPEAHRFAWKLTIELGSKPASGGPAHR